MQTRSAETARRCSICLDQVVVEGHIDSCKHDFCFPCIKKWSEVPALPNQTENSCPVCKQSFTRIHKRRTRVDYNQKRHGPGSKDRETTLQVQYKKQSVVDVNFLLTLMDIFSRYRPGERANSL